MLPRARNLEEIKAGTHTKTGMQLSWNSVSGKTGDGKRAWLREAAGGQCPFKHRADTLRARLNQRREEWARSFRDGFSGTPPPPSSVSEVTRCPLRGGGPHSVNF